MNPRTQAAWDILGLPHQYEAQSAGFARCHARCRRPNMVELESWTTSWRDAAKLWRQKGNAFGEVRYFNYTLYINIYIYYVYLNVKKFPVKLRCTALASAKKCSRQSRDSFACKSADKNIARSLEFQVCSSWPSLQQLSFCPLEISLIALHRKSHQIENSCKGKPVRLWSLPQIPLASFMDGSVIQLFPSFCHWVWYVLQSLHGSVCKRDF